MPAKTELNGSVLVAKVSGEIDHHSARSIREAIDCSVERSRPEKLILDFSEVSFMDSSGIGLIMGRFRLMSEIGGKLEIANARPSVSRMIKLAGLERLGIKGV